ncbi:hypothetical protein JKG47_20380 [Acidithiobacillus sp. MC6.1]|nr:hypothetical protein [Acidithiobacillus sp. MC6.1]
MRKQLIWDHQLSPRQGLTASGHSTPFPTRNDEEPKAIAEAQAKKPILSAEDKIDYAKGLGSLGGGILHYVGMKNAASSFSSSVSSLSPMAAAQDASALSSGLYVVKSLPSSISNLGSSLNEAVSFAKSNKIAVPASATNALGSFK